MHALCQLKAGDKSGAREESSRIHTPSAREIPDQLAVTDPSVLYEPAVRLFQKQLEDVIALGRTVLPIFSTHRVA
jgi:hypothetical protein